MRWHLILLLFLLPTLLVAQGHVLTIEADTIPPRWARGPYKVGTALEARTKADDVRAELIRSGLLEVSVDS